MHNAASPTEAYLRNPPFPGFSAGHGLCWQPPRPQPVVLISSSILDCYMKQIHTVGSEVFRKLADRSASSSAAWALSASGASSRHVPNSSNPITCTADLGYHVQVWSSILRGGEARMEGQSDVAGCILNLSSTGLSGSFRLRVKTVATTMVGYWMD